MSLGVLWGLPDTCRLLGGGVGSGVRVYEGLPLHRTGGPADVPGTHIGSGDSSAVRVLLSAEAEPHRLCGGGETAVRDGHNRKQSGTGLSHRLVPIYGWGDWNVY